ncbi:twin-arginine translocase TatA/TatE family subunit [Sphingomonas sp.]|jgi:sec-independent protein translocase protein TatA|uniref:twin-arginine translocase TatA/TatE family subunit n=1 Tax=Sphingomonas sp. TaxID=28214 RepID=UPI002DC04304|nr:twin-arginine translocase TatA/TatE family subunit [Sphingomonas sp.]HEU4968308.1 twin-arginine translocase TatA/TatE family subunit [Sphingomonas sp.]
MGGLSIWHWLIVGIVVMLLFGKGRFSDLMGDVAKGIKSFKKGMAEEDEPVRERRVEALDKPRPAVTVEKEPVEDHRPL